MPADQFWGVDRGTAKNVDALMRVIAEDAAAQEAIGIVSNDISDGDSGNLIPLDRRAHISPTRRPT